MGDHQDRTGEVFQDFLQGLPGGDVEMIGWLVEQEQVGAFQGKDGQGKSGAFAAAQGANRFEDIVTGEQVGRQVTARLAAQHFLVKHEFVKDAVFTVQAIVSLGKVANLQVGAQVDFAVQGSLLFEQDFQKGGLSGAVRTDQGRSFAAAQFQFIGGEKRITGVANRQMNRCAGRCSRPEERIATAGGCAPGDCPAC